MQASLAVLLALAAVASAQFAQQFAPAPHFTQFSPVQQVRAPVPILSHQRTHDPSGQYSYSYTTGDGASHSDQGTLKQSFEGPGHFVLVRQGTHSYTSPEGKLIKLSYSADETGYHPTGDHLPVAPAPIV